MTQDNDNSKISPKPPLWFWAVSALALLWNLMGVWQYIWQTTATSEDLAKVYNATQLDMINAQPAWYTGVFALAVFGGALGCLLLLLRKKIALWPLLLSLICVIIQNIYFATAGVYAHIHGGEWVMTLLIPLVAILLVWLARHMSAKHILR